MLKLEIRTAGRDSFRRAGQIWTREPRIVNATDFTADQLEALRTESMLSVREWEEPEATLPKPSPAEAPAESLMPESGQLEASVENLTPESGPAEAPAESLTLESGQVEAPNKPAAKARSNAKGTGK